MTRLFLAAGVAALAISAPAAARPGGNHGGGGGNDRQQVYAVHGGGGGQRAQAQQRPSFAMSRGGGGGGQRFAAMERQPRAERQQFRAQNFAQRPSHNERMSARQDFRANRVEAQSRMAERQQLHANRVQAQNRMAERQQLRANRAQAQNRVAERQQLRANRMTQVQNRMAERQQIRNDRIEQVQNRFADRQQIRTNQLAGNNHGVGYGVGGCPPGLAGKGCMPPGQAAKQGLAASGLALRADRIANADAFRASRLAALTALNPTTRVFAPAQVVNFVGQPVSAVTPFMALNPIPSAYSYLYPNTPDYYYQYGGGYLYQVDRGSNLIAALLPLLTGGYMPGSYLPNSYMNSYVPDYYGLNSFYPASYNAFDYGYGGYGYDNLCNRYANGVVYRVDCVSGMIVDAVPTYVGGYGVGQMLPSAYSYYNVPSQYRSLYYDTSDYNYWYAPGAIYQYDPSSSLITSVAALMSPGFSVGQPLPMGYSTYNVPYAYRSTYYDTPTAWYRYNNGYIYQIDPTTQIVSAIVASILT